MDKSTKPFGSQTLRKKVKICISSSSQTDTILAITPLTAVKVVQCKGYLIYLYLIRKQYASKATMFRQNGIPFHGSYWSMDVCSIAIGTHVITTNFLESENFVK